MRLLLAICYENITVGLALTAFVAYVSSIVSKKYGAIQYALLSLAAVAGRHARARRGGRGVRHVWLCAGVPLDRRDGA